jgi:putative membrane protein
MLWSVGSRRINSRDFGLLETVSALLDGLPWFLAYMGTAVALTLVYVIIYMWVTPHDEIKLIRENNLSASLAFAGSLIGFCLPLASAIANSVALVDCAVWGLIAIIVQIVIFFLVRLPVPKISERIEKGETASGLWLGSASLAGGILNAASMTS